MNLDGPQPPFYRVRVGVYDGPPVRCRRCNAVYAQPTLHGCPIDYVAEGRQQPDDVVRRTVRVGREVWPGLDVIMALGDAMVRQVGAVWSPAGHARPRLDSLLMAVATNLLRDLYRRRGETVQSTMSASRFGLGETTITFGLSYACQEGGEVGTLALRLAVWNGPTTPVEVIACPALPRDPSYYAVNVDTLSYSEATQAMAAALMPQWPRLDLPATSAGGPSGKLYGRCVGCNQIQPLDECASWRSEEPHFVCNHAPLVGSHRPPLPPPPPGDPVLE